MHIETQLRELETLIKSIADIEKTGNAKATAMKKIADTMESNLHQLRMSDRLTVNPNHQTHDFWKNEGESLLRDYNTDKKRHATKIEDLKELDNTVVQKTLAVPNAFRDALEKVKAEIQRAAGIKRQQAKVLPDSKKQKT